MRTVFSAAALASQLLLLRITLAQDDMELATRVTIWSEAGCGSNLGDESVLTSDFDIYKSTVATEDPQDEDLPCRVMSWDHPDWPSDTSSDQYDAWLDASGIEDGCMLLLYKTDNEHDSTVKRDCVTNYDRFDSSTRCVSLSIPKTMGYSYCCGDACGQRTSDDVFKKKKDNDKRANPPQAPRPVEDIFSWDSKRDGMSTSQEPRDVTALKRAAPLDLLNKRGECKFEGDEEPEVRLMGEQLRVTTVDPCFNKNGCSVKYTVSWSEMVGESFGVGAEMGFSLFDIMSASVNFEYTYEESEETSHSYERSSDVDSGFEGYIVWEPLLACATGKLTGDCDDKLTLEDEQEACFVKMLHGNPDGKYSAVRIA